MAKDSKAERQKYLEDYMAAQTPKPQWQRHRNTEHITKPALAYLWDTLDRSLINRDAKGFRKSILPYELKLELSTGERVGIYSVPEEGPIHYKRKKDLVGQETTPEQLLKLNADKNIYTIFLLDHPKLASFEEPEDHTQQHYNRWNLPDFELSKNHYESLAKLDTRKDSGFGPLDLKEGILQSWMGSQLVHHYLKAPEDKDGEPNMTFVKGESVHYKPGLLSIQLPFDRGQPGLIVPKTYEENSKNTMLREWVSQYGAKLL